MYLRNHLLGLPVAIIAGPPLSQPEEREFEASYFPCFEQEETFLFHATRKLYREMGYAHRPDLVAGIWRAAIIVHHRMHDRNRISQLTIPLYVHKSVRWKNPDAVNALWFALSSRAPGEDKVHTVAFNEAAAHLCSVDAYDAY